LPPTIELYVFDSGFMFQFLLYKFSPHRSETES
jgi:hypothetical protein